MVDDLVIGSFSASAGESSDLLRPPLPHIIVSRSRDPHNAQGWRIFISPAAFSASTVGMSRYVSSFPPALHEPWCDRADIDRSQNVPGGSENAISSPPVRVAGV